MVWLLACTSPSRDRIEPAFIEIDLGTTEVGSAESPLPFANGQGSNEHSVAFSARVLRSDHSLMEDFKGDLALKIRPGTLKQDNIVAVEGGVWEGTVSYAATFGPTRIWVTDEGDRDPDSTRVASFAAGVSEPIWYALPTIAEMQATDDPGTNQLAGEYAEIRADDRQIVVTARDAAGFWATDIADLPGTGNSIYVYTFSRADESLAVGTRMGLLNGIDQEYLGSTQLSFPSAEAAPETPGAPEAIVLTGDAVSNDATMELYEASRVRAEGWQISETFTPESADYADFEEYGQWPLTLGGNTVYVESGSTAPDFYPPDYAGSTLTVEGMLKEIYGKWILVVVEAEDINVTSGPRARRASRSHRTVSP